ncbi:DUF1045 domain-containing protein [Paracoccus ravus]|uniref:DUF1045 domain-containing protein n=1 Tax=Paracoccus ravus TaxID=2447760 RepID=UPI001430DF84|nr:DUF1045 domain-containing protein [Paracoccus ravus]
MNFRRFALYHLPDGPLGAFGSAWLGWDARQREKPTRPALAGLPDRAESLTSTPMRYGFHATLKAPFRLRPEAAIADLARRTELLCDHLSPFALDLELRADWGFVALLPRHQPPELLALEQALVTRLDDLRAPLTPAERERRQPERLPETARAHLDHWGYPFVLDLFRYHLTLSNGLPPNRASTLLAALERPLAPLIAAPLRVDRVALLGEDESRHMVLIEEFPLRGP